MTRKQALALARQLRTCPPLQVKQDPLETEPVKRHLDICPFCATSLKNEIEAFEALAEKLETAFFDTPDNSPVRAGQVRAIDPGLSCWQGDYYYNAPEVAVLETGRPGNRAKVAQVWLDTALAGPGDLVPPDTMVQGLSGLFIETWNIYTLDPGFLGPTLGTLDPEIIESVLMMNENPDYLPDWAFKPMPMKDNDPRIYFRDIEMNIGQAFAAMTVRHDAPEPQKPRIPVTLEALKATLEKKFTGISWDWPPKTLDECMAVLRFPSQVLPMRAAEDDDQTLTAGYFCFSRDGLKDARPVECQIRYQTSPPDSYSVSGVIEGLPETIPQDAFQCYIKDEKNRLLMACNWVWEGAGKRFMAVFDRPLCPGEGLCLFIVHHTEWDLP